jgi:aminoglycoside phosphotransferase (APT) family kinase protein
VSLPGGSGGLDEAAESEDLKLTAPTTRPVAEHHQFDLEGLAAYLRAQGRPFEGDLQVEQFAGGQSNPTYLVTAGGERYVLRRKPPGALLPSAHAVDREFRIMRALAHSGVPVPQVIVLCEDPAVIGTAFMLMEYVQGRVFWDATLPGLEAAERLALYDELNRVIAALHAVDYGAVGLADYGRPGNYLKRQIDRWTRQYRAAATEPIEAMERLIEWLPAHVPESDETTVVHGDYRIDNVIFHPTEPRILAVLDWELSTLGHPLADLAYHVMTWRVTPGEFRGMRGADLAALGIPDEAAYVAAYCRRTGRAGIADWDYYLAFNMFRMAAILQGILARALQGNAASAEALATGQRARPMAEAGWRQVEQMQNKP